MKNPGHLIAGTLFSFAAYLFLSDNYFSDLNSFFYELFTQKEIAFFTTYLIVGSPILIYSVFIYKRITYFGDIGLGLKQMSGLSFAFLCSLPMFVGYAIFFDFNHQLSFNDFFVGALCAAFFEELYYRGLFFGMLYRKTKLGFILSVLAGAIIFGSMHLYQSQDPSVLAGIFLVTFLGAVLFAWLYVEWGYNLWVPMGLHFFMNLSWMLFSAGDNALGALFSNIFRVLTIAIAIIGTIIFRKKMNRKMRINKNTLLIKK